MFSALYMVTFADGVADDQKKSFSDEARAAAAAVSDVNIATETFGVMPGGDYFAEVGFADQDAYEAKKAESAWTDLQALMHDETRVAATEFAAYGEGTLTLQEKKASGCHRVLMYDLIDDPDPAMVEKMESVMNDMCDHVPGLLNCKFARIVESSGTHDWKYAFECDFDDPSSFTGKYMTTPFHFCYIDKFFEPACDEWVVDPDLRTPFMSQETPFLANFVA